MGMKNKDPLEKEWKAFLKREEKTLKGYGNKKEPFLEKKLKTVVPDGLQEKLNTLFLKAFRVILQNGTGVIEKTYPKKKLMAEFKTREYAQKVYATRKNLKAARKTAGGQTIKNVAGAGAEGAVLGLLGIGLPDIPLFLGVIFRSLYTLALHYGIDYEEGEEQELLLDLLTLSLYRGKDFRDLDAAMNRRLFAAAGKDRKKRRGGEAADQNGGVQKACSRESVRRASGALSEELLYMKFLQGIPVAGVIGGIYDGIYLKKITDYAAVKLERRYLLSKMEP